MNDDKAIVKRVDKLIRDNNLKYLEAKAHQEYQKSIEHYDKSRKKEMLKSYCDVIKQGNKKAVEKAKQKEKIKKIQKAKQSKRRESKNTISQKQEAINQTDKSQNHVHITAEQKQQIDRGIQFRAELRLKQLEMQRVNKQLQQQKKKTKLHQLNQKCKKLAARSTKKIDIASIPQERRKILEAFQQKAMQQVEQLDNIIEAIIDKANGKGQGPVSSKNITHDKQDNQLKRQKRENQLKKQKKSHIKGHINFEQCLEIPVKRNFQSQKQITRKSEQEMIIPNKQNKMKYSNNQEDFLSLDHPLFSKNEDQLLSLDFIPI